MNLPEFTNRADATNPRKQNRVVEEVNRRTRITGDGIILVSESQGGTVIRLSVEALLPRIPKVVAGSANKFGVVTECNSDTGLVTVQVATGGTCANPTTTDGETVTAWAGDDGAWPRIGDSCLLIHNGGDVTPEYVCYVPIKGIIWEEPAEEDLSSWQDNPNEDTTSCDDTVE